MTYKPEVVAEVVSSDVTPSPGARLVLIDASAGNRTVTLPAATDRPRPITFKRSDSASLNLVTVAAGGLDLIDNTLATILLTIGESFQLMSDGAVWWRIS